MASLDVFLSTPPAEATTIAPANIVPYADWTADEVRRYLAAAVKLSRMVNRRLNTIHGSPRRETMWGADDGPEAYWFGAYSEGKLNKVWTTFQGIERHLSSKRLDVKCQIAKPGIYGMAMLAFERIWLYDAWHSPPLGSTAECDAERVQTFVHEASHICGRFSAAESKGYGRDAAHGLTKYRMRATRNADNFGYYALDVLDRASLPA